MPLPNFVVIGAAKSGSTTLCRQLAQHPDIFISTPKEPDFFNRYYEKGLEWYKKFFEKVAYEKAIGEGSVLYSISSLFPEVPKRMAQYIPKAKLIYIVRHPLERIESMWCEHVSDGEKIPEFNQAVREWRPLLDGSKYHQQLGKFLHYYDKHQILILFLDEYKIHPGNVLKHCFEFLGVNSEYEAMNPYDRLNKRSDLTMFSSKGAWFRNTKMGVMLRSRLGDGIKDFLRPYFRKKIDVSAYWDRPTLTWAVDTLKNDTNEFLAYCGKDKSIWDFSEDWCKKRLETTEHYLRTTKIRFKKKPFVLSALDFHE